MATLPPIPAPNTRRLISERILGVTVVGGIICGCVSVTHIAMAAGVGYPRVWEVIAMIIHAKAVFATFAFVALHLIDTGVIRRSPETCVPLPAEVAERLRSGEGLAGLENPTAEDGSSYCVRCCVWRRPPHALPTCCPPSRAACSMVAVGRTCARNITGKGRLPHHCKTCGKCVEGFDHHCGVLGLCVTTHNMPLFLSLTLVGQIAVYIVMGGFGAAAFKRLGAAHFFLGLGALCVCCCFNIAMSAQANKRRAIARATYQPALAMDTARIGPAAEPPPDPPPPAPVPNSDAHPTAPSGRLPSSSEGANAIPEALATAMADAATMPMATAVARPVTEEERHSLPMAVEAMPMPMATVMPSDHQR